MQVHPSALNAVGTDNRRGGAPVRLLHPWLVEDHPFQLADDVAALVQLVLGVQVDVGRVTARGYLWQEPPVGWLDLDHVVDAGIVRHLHLGQPEVGALAGVARDDVVDDGAAVLARHLAHGPELGLGSERRVDLGADPVEVPIDARGR